jgi:hypothetical protein
VHRGEGVIVTLLYRRAPLWMILKIPARATTEAEISTTRTEAPVMNETIAPTMMTRASKKESVRHDMSHPQIGRWLGILPRAPANRSLAAAHSYAS